MYSAVNSPRNVHGGFATGTLGDGLGWTSDPCASQSALGVEVILSLPAVSKVAQHVLEGYSVLTLHILPRSSCRVLCELWATVRLAEEWRTHGRSTSGGSCLTGDPAARCHVPGAEAGRLGIEPMGSRDEECA